MATRDEYARQARKAIKGRQGKRGSRRWEDQKRSALEKNAEDEARAAKKREKTAHELRSVRMQVPMTPSTRLGIDVAAAAEGISRAHLCHRAITEYLKRRHGMGFLEDWRESRVMRDKSTEMSRARKGNRYSDEEDA